MARRQPLELVIKVRVLAPQLRVLGFPLDPPQAVINRILADLGAIARAAREAPEQLDRILELGEEIVEIGRAVLEIAERLDERGAAILALGARLDVRAEGILELGARLDVRTSELIDLGNRMHELGDRVDERGAEVAGQAGAVVETATELIAALPTLERALELATPLEGAIDRFGRLVDRLPGGRRPDVAAGPGLTGRPGAGGSQGPTVQPGAGSPPDPAIVPDAEPSPVRWPRPPAAQ